MVCKFEGVMCNVGKYVGGVVIVLIKIIDFVLLYCDEEGKYLVIQFDKSDVEYVGLVKFDFFGLCMLIIINWVLEMINKWCEKNGELLLDIVVILLDDKKSFDMLQCLEIMVVFQFELCGMKDLIKCLQLDCFEDMIVLVVLFCFGLLQLGMVDNFIDCKYGCEEFFYLDVQWQYESLKLVLELIYGIILYQEQVMQIVQVFFGYIFGGVDMLCCVMGKKKLEEMVKQCFVFEEGVKKNGIDGELVMKIFDLVEKFVGYGFNKLYFVVYVLVFYQMLWLKVYYLVEFMVVVMIVDMDNIEKVVGLVDECWWMGLKILLLDINFGLYYFYVNDEGEIVYGIGVIKGVGEGLIEVIIDVCNQGGYFCELFDLCVWIDIKKFNCWVLEKLIMFGVFDCLGLYCVVLMNLLGDVLKVVDQYVKVEVIGQVDMFGVLVEELE